MAYKQKGIDDLDREIILELQEDARRHFKVIAQKLGVSEGTIKNRVTRLLDKGVLKLEAAVDPFALPKKVAAVIGLNLGASDHKSVMKRIAALPQVTSVWRATGRFHLFFELMVDSIEELDELLASNYLDEMNEVISSETFVILHAMNKHFKLS